MYDHFRSLARNDPTNIGKLTTGSCKRNDSCEPSITILRLVVSDRGPFMDVNSGLTRDIMLEILAL